MATGTYNRGKYCIATGLIVLSSSDLRLLLVSNAYAFNPKDTFTNIGAELGGAGYVRQKLQNVVVTQDDVNNLIKLTCDSLVYPGAFFGTPDAAIVYQEGSSDLSRELIACLDLEPKVSTNGGDLTLNINPFGVLQIK